MTRQSLSICSTPRIGADPRATVNRVTIDTAPPLVREGAASADMTAGPAMDAGALERAVRAEIVAAERPDRPIRRRLRRARAWIAQHPRLEIFYRIGVGVVGTVMAIGGLILVPLPGPGWLIVFLGLAVLGTEFHWAHRVAQGLKRLLDRFWVWWRARRAARQAQRIARRA